MVFNIPFDLYPLRVLSPKVEKKGKKVLAWGRQTINLTAPKSLKGDLKLQPFSNFFRLLLSILKFGKVKKSKFKIDQIYL